MSTGRRLGLLALSGLLGVAAFPVAFPFGPRRPLDPHGLLEPLAYLCLVPALMAMRGLRATQAFWAGQLAGMVFFTGTVWWVEIAMTSFGGLPRWLAGVLLVGLAAWCAFHWAMAFALARWFAEKNGWPMGLTLPPIWMATELCRNYFCTGFPWANLGYSQAHDLWLSQGASVVGVYGLAFVVAGVNGALYETVRWLGWKEREVPLGLVLGWAATLGVGHLYGAWRVGRWEHQVRTAERVTVAVVQGNVDQKLKNAQGQRRAAVLRRYNPPTLAADAAGAELIVWPEASFPGALPIGIRQLRNAGLAADRYRASLLVGVDLVEPPGETRAGENAALLLRPNLEVAGAYAKNHLVPFGEYVPLGLDRLLSISHLAPGSFRPGTAIEPLPLPLASGRTVKLGVEICFDAVFPEISRAHAKAGADLLINLTNDAWFGFSSAPFQFVRMVQLRAIETGLPMARAANTGISGFIDPLGRISQATEVGIVEGQAGQLLASQLVPAQWRLEALPLVRFPTAYTVLGDTPAYLACLFCVGGALRALRGRRPGPRQSAGL